MNELNKQNANIITIGIVIITFFILWDNLHRLINHTGKNFTRHKDHTSTYAHFSKVESISYFVYPRLLLTHPTYITLNENEGLFIPKRWWHWVSTNEPTAAINFWYINDDDSGSFYKIKYEQVIDWDTVDAEKVSVWKSDGSDTTRTSSMGEFRKSTGIAEYTITLDNFGIGANNKSIKNILKSYVKPPCEMGVREPNAYDFNLWVSNGTHDTGLHYDDEDGFLCVLYGKKNIILYPPEDSRYLYPYPVTPFKWLTNPTLNFRYNSNQNFGSVKGPPSTHLLYETCKKYPRVLSEVSKFHETFKANNLVWGFKKTSGADGVYRWELYHYTLDQQPSITSWDLTNSTPVKGDAVHFYYNHDKDNTVKLPFWGYGTEYKNERITPEANMFVVDCYEGFVANYDNHMKKLGFDHIKNTFKELICNKYSTYEISVHNKKENQIFVQYLGIQTSEFLSFLIENNYPTSLVNYVRQHINKLKINHEITIVYDTTTREPIRSGFYGLL